MTAPPVATYTSNLAEWERDHDAAIDTALLAVAEFYANELQTRLRRGFTSGAFTPDQDTRFPGTIADSIEVSLVTREKGVPTIYVYSTSRLAIMWEKGHLSVFTDRFERVPVWRATSVQNAHRMTTIFQTTYRRRMAKWYSGSSGRAA